VIRRRERFEARVQQLAPVGSKTDFPVELDAGGMAATYPARDPRFQQLLAGKKWIEPNKYGNLASFRT
jgi:hypothetical protein